VDLLHQLVELGLEVFRAPEVEGVSLVEGHGERPRRGIRRPLDPHPDDRAERVIGPKPQHQVLDAVAINVMVLQPSELAEVFE
jgi:hypothetical protein